MRSILRRRPSPAVTLAFVALVAALSGSAIALPGSNGVNSGDIKNNSVRSKDVRNNNLTGKDIKNLAGGDVKNESLSGSDINESSLGKVPNATAADAAGIANRANSSATVDQLKTIGSYKNVQPSFSNDDTTAAREGATEIPLFAVGALSIYGKCYRDADSDAVYADVFIRTTQNGSVFTSNDEDTYGDPFLDTDTSEIDRDLLGLSASGDSSNYYGGADSFHAAAPDGTGISGELDLFVKEGSLPDSQGIYGDGDRCIFIGHMIG